MLATATAEWADWLPLALTIGGGLIAWGRVSARVSALEQRQTATEAAMQVVSAQGIELQRQILGELSLVRERLARLEEAVRRTG